MPIDSPILLFDGVCNFCNRMVNFAIRNDSRKKLRFAPLQSVSGQKLKEKYLVSPAADSIVFIDKGKAYSYAAAGIRVCRYLDWPAKMLYAFIIIPSFISKPIYKWVARNRYKWFGRKDSCMIPTKELRERFLE